MASSKRQPTMPMVLLLSLSVQLYQRKASCTILKFQIKRYSAAPFSYDINALTSSPFQGTFWYHSHFKNQYCDGLRGALIIYDPNDPQKSLYDIDDGRTYMSWGFIILAEISFEMIPLSLLRTGITIFRQMLPQSRKLNWIRERRYMWWLWQFL